MRLEDLDTIVWKCYQIKDDVEEEFDDNNLIEITGATENIQNDNCLSDDVDRSQMSDYLVNILDELYYIKGLERICSRQYEAGDGKRLFLEELSEQYNSIIKFKQFYYKEVQESISKINSYIDDDNINLPKYIFRLYEEPYFSFEELHYNVFRMLDYFNVSSDLFEKIITAMDKLWIEKYTQKGSDISAKDIELWINFVELFREEVFGVTGEITWLIFLCALTQMICRDDSSSISILRGIFIARWDIFPDFDFEMDSNEEIIRWLNSLIRETTSLVEVNTENRIIDMQRNLLTCYKCDTVTKELFDIKAKMLIKALKANKKMKERYLNSSGTGCIAIMYHDSNRYVAISGTNIYDYNKIIDELLDKKYINLSITDDTRFYCNEDKYITYGTYKKWLHDKKVDSTRLNGCVNRMFSCCERKLLTKVYGSRYTAFEIYVKKKPCVLCEEALKEFGDDRYYMVHYVKNGGGKMNMRTYDYLKRLGNIIARDGIPTNSIYV